MSYLKVNFGGKAFEDSRPEDEEEEYDEEVRSRYCIRETMMGKIRNKEL